jgi:hypothetical protein
LECQISALGARAAFTSPNQAQAAVAMGAKQVMTDHGAAHIYLRLQNAT